VTVVGTAGVTGKVTVTDITIADTDTITAPA